MTRSAVQAACYDHIEAIISLPQQLFCNTGIPVRIIVARPRNEKPPERTGKILFINADREFEPGRAQNYLRAGHIEKIVATFQRYESIPGYSAVMPLNVIQSPTNDYSLNIRRYADNSPPPEPRDVRAHLHGGVPRSEVDALAPLFTAHGFDPSRVQSPFHLVQVLVQGVSPYLLPPLTLKDLRHHLRLQSRWHGLRLL